MAGNNNSLKSRVLEALRANIELARQKDNAELYALVGAETVAQKSSVRVFKKKFNDGDYDWITRPDGRRPARPKPTEENTQAFDAQASVFRVSGKGDLTDKIVEYFKTNPHKLEERSNVELYAAVGADDKKQKNVAMVVKSRLKKVLKESGLGVVAISTGKESKDFAASFEEMETDLKTEGLILNARQMKAAETYYGGTTQIDAYMTVYKEADYEFADKNASAFFKKKSVKRYLMFLKQQDVSETVRRKRRLEDLEFRIAEAAVGSNFLEPDENGKAKFKRIVDGSVFDGIKSFKVATKTFESAKGTTGEESLVSFKLHNAPSIARKLRQSIGGPRHNGSANSSDLEIHELWERFIKRDAEDSLSAVDFANELTARDYPVPDVIKLQAQYELATREPPPAPPPGGGDIIDPDNFSHENLNREKERILGEYGDYYQRQLEDFLPEREREIHEIATKHGLDRQEKPRDMIITRDDKLEPPAHRPEDDKFDLSGKTAPPFDEFEDDEPDPLGRE